ncbi:MAG: Hsp20/alpha crystallin family protein [Opitutales bacterium]
MFNLNNLLRKAPMNQETALAQNDQVSTNLDRPTGEAHPRRFVTPSYTVDSGKEAYRIHVTLPGVNRDDVSITLEEDTLQIQASRQLPVQDKWKAHYRELPAADYRLVLQLNVPVDGDKIAARTDRGILTVTLPVVEAARPRKIEVE